MDRIVGYEIILVGIRGLWYVRINAEQKFQFYTILEFLTAFLNLNF